MRFFPGSILHARLLLVVLLAITPTIALAIYSHLAGLGLVPDLIGLVAAFTLVLAWLGGDLFIVRRARALMAATHRLTEGDLSARSGVPYGRGEIGQLARAFDEMAAGLELRDRISREAERTLLTTVDVLRETDEQRQRLLARLDHAQEEERKRIALDIHDDTLQVITAVGMHLDTLRRGISDSRHLRALERLQEDVTLSIARLRRLVFDQPPSLAA